MSNFTPLVEKEYDFDGDHIKLVFSRLKRKDMLAAMPGFKKLIDAETGSDEWQDAIGNVLDNIADVLPDYVKSFEGLTDFEGTPISIEQVVSEMYFVKLCSQITTDVMTESSVLVGNE